MTINIICFSALMLIVFASLFGLLYTSFREGRLTRAREEREIRQELRKQRRLANKRQ